MTSFLNLNGAKIAPFKNSKIQPYGAFVNTTDVGVGAHEYRIKQSLVIHGQNLQFNWPSSEHAYHGQKILYLMQNLASNHLAQPILSQMVQDILSINREYSPRNDYDALVQKYLPALQQAGLKINSKFDFDRLCGSDYHPVKNKKGLRENLKFMQTIIQLKLEQHQDLQQAAMDCAREGIFPVEVSRHDVTWASGPDGTGENQLGIMILQEGIRLLQQKGETPKIPANQVAQAYSQLMNTNDLSHNHLEKNLAPNNNWIMQASKQNQQPKPQTNYSYYLSQGGNQRLVIQNNQVIGYEFRKDKNSNWEISKDPTRFAKLEMAFKKPSSAVKSENLGELKHYYSHAVNGNNPGRFHLFSVSSKTYPNASGDHLKTKILLQFKAKLEQCSNKDAFENTVQDLKRSEDYKILSTGQGLITRLFGLQTSSMKAFDKMIEEISQKNHWAVPSFKK